MSDHDPADEAIVRAALEPHVPDPAPRWSAALGDELDRDGRRRGVRSRPPYLWPTALALVLLGVLMLALALAQA